MTHDNGKNLTLNSALITCALLLLQPGMAHSVSLGQPDNFTDGSLQNWATGRADITAAFMSNQIDGGPAGTGDNYLQMSSDGSITTGGGNRITLFNQLQWQGDYLNAGITGIAMDIKNISSDAALNLRLAINGGFIDSSFNSIGGLFSTVASVTLDSGSEWTHVVFSLRPEDLVAVIGQSNANPNNDVMAALANVTELRLLNSPAPDWNGQKVTATVGFDNITAVPLPPSLLLFTSGFVALLIKRRRNFQ